MALLLSLLSAGQVTAGDLRGIVRNAETASPLGKVTLYLAGTDHRTVSNESGRFEIREVPEGEFLLVVTAVGFGLVKQKLRVPAAGAVELDVVLSPGTQITNEVTVSASDLSSRPELSQTEIHELKSVLADDPFRAIQQLPGIVASDDFNSGFALQGSGFDRVGLLFDGIPVYAFLHTVEGQRDTGSTSVLSAELIEGLDLVPGASSAEFGANSAGFLRLRSRSGNESRWRSLLSVSGSAVMGLSEGPLGKGSWIASARKSYVDWIVKRIEPRADLNFGFQDFFAKVVQHASRDDLVSLTFFHGNTGQENVEEHLGYNTVDRGRFKTDLLHANWSRTVGDWANLSAHGYWQRAVSLNRNIDGREIWNNEQQVTGLRAVADLRVRPGWLASAGVTAEGWQASNFEDFYDYGSGDWLTLSRFKADTSRQELFAQTMFTPARFFSVTAGCNWNRLAAVEGGRVSPFLTLEARPANQTLTVSYGQSHQFPFLIQLYGQYGNSRLEPETARVVEGAWLYRLGKGWAARLSGYRRRRHSVPWKRDGQWRLTSAGITPPTLEPFASVLRDRSTGGEVQLARRAANGLAGWIGYAWGQSQWSERDEDWFPGNYDQRHSVSLFAQYRWTSQIDVSTKWKLASGLPVPAYVTRINDDYYLSAYRNLARLPNYSRLDFRAAKSFNRDRYRLTLFVEVLNLLNRKNVRFTGVGFDHVNRQTGRVDDLDHSQLPILPTAGLAVEF